MPDDRVPVGSLRPRDFNNEVQPPKPEPKKKHLEQVTKGNVATREKSAGSKFLDKYFEEDVQVIKKRMWTDIVWPSIQNTLLSICEMVILQGSTSPRARSGRTTFVDYNGYSRRVDRDRDRDDRRERRSSEPISRRSNDLDEFIFQDRLDAERVLDELVNVIYEYQETTVADLMELAGTTSMNFTDNKWGWRDLSSARVRRIRDGYLLELPKPIQLD